MAGLTAELARVLAEAKDFEVPPEATGIIKLGFIDCIATMLAGRGEEIVQILERTCPIGDEAAVLLGPRRASARDAALINGTAGHALDFDDVALLGHPSTVLVPVVLAEAERLGRNGEDILRAYLFGYEVWAELARRESDALQVKGWHPTGVYGTVAAAAAASVLAGVGQRVASNALALAASMSSGLTSNFGSMVKPFHAGNAAARGMEAARLALAGVTGSPDALEHPAGFLAAVSPRGRVDRESPSDRLGTQLHILESRLSIKKFPVCFASHRAIDGIIALAQQHDLKLEEVAEVIVSFGPAQGAMLRNNRPQSALEAKFSIEFAMASSLLVRDVGLAQLTDEFVMRPEIQNAFAKVHTRFLDTHLPGENGLSLTENVEVLTVDGRRFVGENIRHAKGHAKIPLNPVDLWSKFSACTAGVNWLDPEALFEKLGALEELEEVSDLAA